MVRQLSHRLRAAYDRWARWFDAACLALLVLIVAPRILPSFQAATGIGGEEREVAEWEMVTLADDTLTSRELEGKVVVVTFWATWCSYCDREMPSLQKVWEGGAQRDVVVLALSIDSGAERVISRYVEEGGYTFPVGRATKELKQVFGGIRGVPTTFVLDRDGVVRHRIAGYFTGVALERAVQRLAAEVEDSG